ncbi:hypothetical protein SAMN04515617_10184 [Collimonas sp. OK242]|jgi:hypothetical protein|uniref:hypothetical protein n=1 Tax=Collimonas sp. OK242 TaxID=1798195 RepID=UPI0008970A48|nr:hypothetical protein [Collimonas sp. OK242]SDX07848.1 hypothetical protein SAMN04515617_10184 [Collimonas sp. OK242]
MISAPKKKGKPHQFARKGDYPKPVAIFVSAAAISAAISAATARETYRTPMHALGK